MEKRELALLRRGVEHVIQLALAGDPGGHVDRGDLGFAHFHGESVGGMPMEMAACSRGNFSPV